MILLQRRFIKTTIQEWKNSFLGALLLGHTTLLACPIGHAKKKKKKNKIQKKKKKKKKKKKIAFKTKVHFRSTQNTTFCS